MIGAAAALTSEIRRGVFARLRGAGPEYWALAAFVTTVANLIDFAAVPSPGEGAGGGFVVAALARILLVLGAGYAIMRRMAEVPRPLAPGLAFLRFAAFSIISLALIGTLTQLIGRATGIADQPLSTQWLIMFAAAAVLGVAVIAVSPVGPALAAGAPFRGILGVVRRTRGMRLPLAAVFLQCVLPFAAVHIALTLIASRLPLSGRAVAALALIDGVVSAVQLLFTAALFVTAWRMGEGRQALRKAGSRR
ncbi:MAG: hypothetical protein JWL91_2590 [Sphingomonas bacterium]|nr:hypothetical protein [Sphingomonas bacterium]MDB5690714.1 hypothetical protein [Sphingomonas bacterium]